MIGLPILGSGWLLFAISVAFPPRWMEQQLAVFPLVVSISIIAACVARLVSVVRQVHHTRREVDHLPPEIRDA